MWCTRWYLPLLLLPFPTAPPFFLLVLVFSLTLHARPCLYCIVLLVALFTSSCYWAPTPLDIPSHALESIIPTLSAPRATIDLQSLLAAPAEPTSATTASGPHITYTARLERPKRCWCAPQNLFEPFNITDWEARSSVLVSVRRGLWDWLQEEELEGPSVPETKRESEAGEKEELVEPKPAVDPSTEVHSQAADAPLAATSWRSRWATIQGRVASYGRSVGSRPSAGSIINSSSDHVRPEVRSPPVPLKNPPLPVPHGQPSAPITSSASTPTLAPAPTSEPTNGAVVPTLDTSATSQPWLRRQYDLRPYGGGIILDFGWGRG
ncbi:hypothetical protein BDV93DRAFT_523564 [Ceratobasidium sp. AG-I]|nr:hypothetical protein BDV93DRAFT_523564 [Ceratobasidium sp. AG-I]